MLQITVIRIFCYCFTVRYITNIGSVINIS